jgi:hypothetical protein
MKSTKYRLPCVIYTERAVGTTYKDVLKLQ